MSLSEPSPPQRGQTAAERAAELPPVERQVTPNPAQWIAQTIPPAVYTGQARSGLSKALLLPFYPLWALGVLAAGVLYAIVYLPLWVLLAPVRARQKRVDPEGYEKSQGR